MIDSGITVERVEVKDDRLPVSPERAIFLNNVLYNHIQGTGTLQVIWPEAMLHITATFNIIEIYL